MFPVDDRTLGYLRETGRPAELIELVEAYTKAQGLFRTGQEEITPRFSDVMDFDLAAVEPSLAGPRRPQDRVPLAEVGRSFSDAFDLHAGNGTRLGDGSVAIAAITSCTNTSNPALMLAAGLLAKKAVERGLETKPWVKTSLAPGSRVVSDYLDRAGLTEYLDALHFNLVGFGCTTCIGNSGPLPEDVAGEITDRDLSVAAVLSGNRNFEARIHPQVRANYLASPPLVVAYALAGTVNSDLTTEPLGIGSDGNPVYLRDVWPTADEVQEAMSGSLGADLYGTQYGRIFDGDERWRELPVPQGELFAWDDGLDLRPRGDVLRARARPVRHRGRPRAGAARRLRDDRPHLAGRIDPAARRPPARYLVEHGDRAARLQQLRRPARQPRGDGARHVRQHPPAGTSWSSRSRAASRCTSPTASRCRSTTPPCATPARACRWS